MPEDTRLRNWRHRLAAAGEALLDLFFPPRCPGCGRVGFTFCDACQARIEPPTAPACIRCGHPTDAEQPLPYLPGNAVLSRPDRIQRHLRPPLPRRHPRTQVQRRAQPGPTARRAHGCCLAAGQLRRRRDHPRPAPRRAPGRARLQPVGVAGAHREPGSSACRSTRPPWYAPRPRSSRQRSRHSSEEGTSRMRLPVAGMSRAKMSCWWMMCAPREARWRPVRSSLRAAGAASVWAFTLARARWEPGHTDPAPDADDFRLSPASGDLAVRESA